MVNRRDLGWKCPKPYMSKILWSDNLFEPRHAVGERVAFLGARDILRAFHPELIPYLFWKWNVLWRFSCI